MVTAFVSCSKSKKSYPAPARDLYQGALFKKALAYAEAHFDHVYILSAKYGVVHPDQIIEPYDKTLKEMSKKEREEWYQLVKKQMQELSLPKPYVFFTGHLYCCAFEGEKPLEGLSIGKQLQWFNLIPYHLTRSCYKNQPVNCGKCGICRERLQAFAEINKTDPVEYETEN